MAVSRRHFFQTLSAAALAGGWRLPAADMIIRGARPEDFEMPLSGFDSWITPNERFFVRTHVYTPSVDLAAWRLRVEGEVSAPLTLSMNELKQLPRVELVSVLECAGNGRSFYQPTLAGLQWQHGAVGNGRWAGVRLADVLKKAGYKASAKEVLFNGADVPIGTMPDFQRAIPLEKALHADTMLAFEMNGQPLPASHGFPLRVIAPGWAGDSWVKWLTHIEVRDKEFDGFFMKTAYRRPVRTVTPGAPVDASLMTPVTLLGIKSVIASPVEGQMLAEGPATVRGVAWSGESPVARVDVSTDNGRTWQPAKLGTDQARYAWRMWEAQWTPRQAGSYVLMARAFNRAGETQPLVQEWNPSGYLWNVVQQVRVEVGAKAGLPQSPPPSTYAPFPEKVKTSCIGCHGEEMITGQRLTRPQWEREVDKMKGWGASVKPEDRSEIVDYLLSQFGLKR
ncbi:MAG: molybdopterin-dependent oxidoreductase [Candidatus Solibacter usitatus]|nr:molybdopterin-dependent oxidoreductase [Candidatus Solibacter usitatus]